MAIKTTEQLKRWFGRGCYPTESQFGDLIDSFRHKDAEIRLTEIRGLAEELNRKYDSRQGALLLARVNELAERHGQLAGELENQLAAIGYSKERFAEILGIVEKYAELEEAIANLDEYIIPHEIQPQIDYNRKAVDSLNDRIGVPTQAWENELGGPPLTMPGIAPLNESGVIAARFLPSFVDDVMDFDGFVAWEGSFAGKEYKGDLSEVDHRVLFNPAAKRFILEVTPVSSTGKPQTPEYYPVWELEENQQLCLGAATAVGYTPLKSKTYYCPATTVSYRWNGTSMAPCGSHLELGKEVNTAYPGDAGKLLEVQKADRTELSPVLSRDPEEELESVEPDFLTLMLRKNEQVLTDEERRQVMENLGRPDIEWLITYFNYMANRYVAGYGGYNEATGYFELGTVKDLTVQDVLRIILSPQGISGCSITDSEAEGRMAYSEVRALFPIKLSAWAFGQSNFSRRYFGCKELEEVVFLRDYGSFVNNSFYRAFYDCLKLRVLKFDYTSVATCTFGEAFNNCYALEDFTPPCFWRNIVLSDSPRLSVASLECIIARATPPEGDTKGITITLHADAFARMTDEILSAAAAKNITLTTP